MPAVLGRNQQVRAHQNAFGLKGGFEKCSPWRRSQMHFCFLERQPQVVVRCDENAIRILGVRQFADAMSRLESPLRGIIFDFQIGSINLKPQAFGALPKSDQFGFGKSNAHFSPVCDNVIRPRSNGREFLCEERLERSLPRGRQIRAATI